MIAKLLQVWTSKVDGGAFVSASYDSGLSSKKNSAPSIRALLCLLLLASATLFGLVGCSPSSGGGGGGGSTSASITSLSPTSGAVGTSITITGSNFGSTQGTSTVTFNGTSATPTSWSASSIVVTVPSGTTTGNVVVTVAGVASNGVNFVVPAIITSLSAATGAVNTNITITGSNFGAVQGGSALTFNGLAATVVSWSATSIVVTVPVGATAGNVVVTSGGIPSNGEPFTPGPSITGLSNSSGAVGASITITGASFGATQGSSTVTFNGTSAGAATTWSATSIAVKVPAGATNGNIVVTVNSLPSNGSGFTVILAPAITSLSQLTGAVNTALTITGSNFGTAQGSSTVTFNSTSAGTATSWAAGSITVDVPVGATTGNVVVTVAGIASNGSPFTPGPSVTGLAPGSGPVATPVTITGTQFGATQGASTVTFGGIAATPTSWSNTSIAAQVPTGAATGAVVVTVNSLASNNNQEFTVGSTTILPDCASSPTGDESSLSGTYVLLVQGWTGTGAGTPIATVTSFIANGAGAIHGGEGDSNGGGNGHTHFAINTTGSTPNSLYRVGKDPTGAGDIGCVSLSNSLGATVTFEFSLGKKVTGAYTRGKLIRFDDTTGAATRGSGILLLQDSAQFGFPVAATNLAFGETGWDASNKPFEGGGFLTVSTSGAFSNLSADFDDNGTLNYGLGTAGGPVPGASNSGGFNAAPDATAGYATITDHYQVNATTETLNYAAYEVNPDEYLYISTDAISVLTPLASGRAVGAASSFNSSSLNGSYVIHQTGSTGIVAEIGLGLLTFTPGTTTIGGTLYQYQFGSAAQTETPSATYSINTTSGRVALTGASGFGTGGNDPVMYITQHSNVYTELIDGFVIGTDADATFGILQASPGSGFTTTSVNGSYFLGSENPGDNTVADGIGAVAISAGACAGTEYVSANTGISVTSHSACTVNITGTNGLGTAGTGNPAVFNGEALFFMDTTSPAIILEAETQ